MILLGSQRHNALKQALATAERDGRIGRCAEPFRADSAGGSDGYLAILDHGLSSALFSASNLELDGWLMNIDQHTKSVQKASAEADLGLQLFYQVWRNTADTIARGLRYGKLDGEIPQKGGILLFLAGLSRCVVLDYDFISDTPRLRVLAVIRDPRSAFDLWTAIDHADIMARNALKAFISTGHKIIAHRGVLIHVDRRHDVGVFGPSIDTLVMAELLAQQLFENEYLYETALEVGSGNGLLSSALASHGGKHLKELFSIDMSPAAVACTIRNVTCNLSGLNLTANNYFISGFFDPTLFRREFDLIVCNPPYIPLPPSMQAATTAAADYLHAVGGLELAETLIRNSASMLKPGGRMLIMASSLSRKELLAAIPDNVTVSFPLGNDGFEVLFDVEAVFHQPFWLKYLIQERGLISRDDAYFHHLHPIWLEAFDTLF